MTTLSPKQAPEPIAIIGIGCRFPGGANNAERYWQLLVEGVDAITEIPPDRWHINKFYHPDPAKPGKTYARWGGFVDNIDQFDPQFFGISPREAARMDPQQRLLLEIVWEALEDGGQVPKHLAGSNTAVFIGLMGMDHQDIQSGVLSRDLIDAQTGTGGAMSIIANRISYVFDFKGPCIALDTACSSSLVAVHLACQSLWQGASTLALAGGVNLMLRPETTIAESKATMLSPDGRSKSFDARANGYVRGEGAGIVVLKPLSTALADGDPIYAVIRGTTINQDGHSNGLTVPNGLAQEAAIREVLQQANVSPQHIQYVEAHGTGTPVGDPIEANTLGRVLGRSRPPGEYCLIGSVKTNIGHLEGAAGIAGLIKVALALFHQKIPPNLHFETPNPKIQFDELRVRVPTTLTPWPENHNGLPRLAGVNSFGFGGTNAHILLECRGEPTCSPDEPACSPDELACSPSFEDSPSGDQIHLLPISARSPEALQAFAQAYQAFLTDAVHDTIPLSDIGYSASLRRGHHNHRLAVVAHSKAEMIENLAAFLNDETRLGLSSDQIITEESSPKLVFVFSGMGQQWWAMGRQLLETEAVFRETIEHCDALFHQHSQWSLLAALTADEAHSRINETQIAQPAILSLQVALAALWRSWGIVPDAIVGHSVGEVAAAQVAGVLSLEQAIQVVYHRSRLQAQTTGQGKMLAVGLSSEAVAPFLIGHEDHVSIGAINSPSGITLSGQAASLENIAHTLEQQEIFCRFLRVDVPYHSPLMAPLQAELINALQPLTPQPAKIPLYSTVTGHIIDGSAIDAHYWAQNIREPVRFAATIQDMIQADYHCFLEIGAHPVLSTYLSEILNHAGRETGRVLPSLRRKEPEQKTLLSSFGKLYTVGYPVDWHRFYPQNGRFVRLPAYPWQKERYWQESEQSQQDRLGEGAIQQDWLGKPVHPLLGCPLKSAHAIWHSEIDLQQLTYLTDHCVQGTIVYPGAAYVEMALAAAKETFGENTVYRVELLEFQTPLFLTQEDSPPLQLTLEPTNQNAFTIYSWAKNTESWVKHATGQLNPAQSIQQPTVELEELRHRCSTERTQSDCYQQFSQLGLQYGPYFQGIEQLWQGDKEAVSQLRIAEDLETQNYLLHPTILDACFQVLMGTVSVIEKTYLPVKIDHIRFYARPDGPLWSHAQLVEHTATRIKGNLQLLDNTGNVLVDIQGLHCHALEPLTLPEDDLYEYQWHLQPRPHQFQNRDVDYFPSPRQLAKTLQQTIRLSTQLERPHYYQTIRPQLDALSTAYILDAFHILGWQPHKHQRVTTARLVEQFDIVPQHQRLLGRFLNILREDGILNQIDDSQWEVITLPTDMPPSQALWQKLLAQSPAYQAELMLIGRCGQHLAKVLQGQVEPLELLFPQGALTTSEHLYQDAPFSGLNNQVVQKVISAILAQLPAGRIIRILEIGAGTGGMTAYLLPKLPTDRTEYVFTDVSEQFTNQAKQKFRHYRFIQYQLLDIEKDPTQQGFDPHSFDLILAANALHATHDLDNTLNQVKQLLASQGCLILMELTHPPRWLDLVFGLLKGWWLFSDFDLRPAHPLLSSQHWQNLLTAVGFTQVDRLFDTDKAEEAEQTILIAQGPTIQQQDAQPPLKTTDYQPHTWLIFADKQGIGQQLATRFTADEKRAILITPGDTYQRLDVNHFQIHPAQPEQMQQLIEVVRAEQPTGWHLIHLWGIDIESLEQATTLNSARGALSALYLIQALAQLQWDQAPHLWLVTQGMHTVGDLKAISVAQSPLWGLGRVLINEQPNIKTRLLDISPKSTPKEIQSLFEELGSDTPEEEIALRGEARYVHRLMRVSLAEIEQVQNQINPEATQSYHLTISEPNEQARWQVTNRKPPGSGEVEIQVCAAALNWKEIVKTMCSITDATLEASFSEPTLGLDCSGIITAVGEGIANFKIGDEVIALARHSLSRYTTSSIHFVMPKPAKANFEEAATLSMGYLTAYYALHELARIRAGDRILIHAATDAVGLAAIQLAQQAGATIFATADNPEKRSFLRSLGLKLVMDSHEFADQIKTQAHGVDIVLNSLPGKVRSKSLSILNPYGRFIDCQPDIENTPLSLPAFQNQSFFTLDFERMIQERPEVIQSVWYKIMPLLTEKTLPKLPYRVFPLAEVGNAFRHRAKQIGLAVLSLQEAPERIIAPVSQKTIRCRTEGTYLITGGMGGFGLAVAQWLIKNGARHLVLMGRSGAASPTAQQTINTLEQTGAKVIIAKADVSQSQDVAEVLNNIEQSMPPLRGIIHGAMVLDDAALLQLNEARMNNVMAPKIMGAWHLHTQTLNIPLDFFVLFSSVSSTIGNPGQGNYVAANAFLDALAHYRQANHLPALTINWGTLDVGYVSQNTDLVERFNSIGIKTLPVQQALTRLGELLQLNAIQILVTRMDWQQLANRYPVIAASPRFYHLGNPADLNQVQAEESQEDSFHNLFLATAQTERQSLLESRISEHVAKVLGTSATKLNFTKPMISMGLDSLMAVELSHGFQKKLGVDVPTMKLLGGMSIAKLATLVNEQLTERQSALLTKPIQDQQHSTSIDRDKHKQQAPEEKEAYQDAANERDWVEGEL